MEKEVTSEDAMIAVASQIDSVSRGFKKFIAETILEEAEDRSMFQLAVNDRILGIDTRYTYHKRCKDCDELIDDCTCINKVFYHGDRTS